MLYFAREPSGESSTAPSLIHLTIFSYSVECNGLESFPLGISANPSVSTMI